MIRIFIIAALFFSSFTSAYGGSCQEKFKFKTENIDPSKTMDKFLSKADTDIEQLKDAYECVHRKARDSVADESKDEMIKAFREASAVNTCAVAFMEKLNGAKDDLKDHKRLKTDYAKVEEMISDTEEIIKNSEKLALGIPDSYGKDFPIRGEISKANEKLSKYSDTKKKSVFSKVNKIVSGDSSLSNEDVFKKLLKGAGYDQDGFGEDFRANLKNKKYSLTAASDRTVVKEKDDEEEESIFQRWIDTSKKTKKDDEKEEDKTEEELKLEKKLADQEKELAALAAKVDDKTVNVIAGTPTSTTPSGTGVSGGLASLSPTRLHGSDRKKDEERKKEWLKRRQKSEARRERDRRRMKRARTKLKFDKGIASSRRRNLRDLFGRRKKPTTEKELLPSDKERTSITSLDKYSKYYRKGKGPEEISSDDYIRRRFADLYDLARLKALTEGAGRSEYAGRYIDIFLLIHSVMDHQYREKGNLMDLAEVVERL